MYQEKAMLGTFYIDIKVTESKLVWKCIMIKC